MELQSTTNISDSNQYLGTYSYCYQVILTPIASTWGQLKLLHNFADTTYWYRGLDFISSDIQLSEEITILEKGIGVIHNIKQMFISVEKAY